MEEVEEGEIDRREWVTRTTMMRSPSSTVMPIHRSCLSRTSKRPAPPSTNRISSSSCRCLVTAATTTSVWCINRSLRLSSYGLCSSTKHLGNIRNHNQRSREQASITCLCHLDTIVPQNDIDAPRHTTGWNLLSILLNTHTLPIHEPRSIHVQHPFRSIEAGVIRAGERLSVLELLCDGIGQRTALQAPKHTKQQLWSHLTRPRHRTTHGQQAANLLRSQLSNLLQRTNIVERDPKISKQRLGGILRIGHDIHRFIRLWKQRFQHLEHRVLQEGLHTVELLSNHETEHITIVLEIGHTHSQCRLLVRRMHLLKLLTQAKTR